MICAHAIQWSTIQTDACIAVLVSVNVLVHEVDGVGEYFNDVILLDNWFRIYLFYTIFPTS